MISFHTKYICGLTLLFVSIASYAQIGINTENVGSNILIYVDGAGDNPTTGTIGATQALNDVVITQSGNVGIGTNNPSTKLHLVTGGTTASPKSALTISDGNEGYNKVLQSDANGLAHWVTYAPGAEIGVFDSDGVNIPPLASTYYNTKSYISLLPGKWVIIFTLIISNTYTGTTPAKGTRIFVNTSIADGSSSSTSISSDIIGSSVFSNSVILGQKGSITGRCIVNNSSSSTKNYYIIAGKVQTTASNITLPNIGKNTGESSFFAFRVKE